VPVLKQEAELSSRWVPKLLSQRYDSRDVPIAEKQGATVGMAMTEKQGGSDVRCSRTWGHVWAFDSHPLMYRGVVHAFVSMQGYLRD
jgi:hypothetical protein